MGDRAAARAMITNMDADFNDDSDEESEEEEEEGGTEDEGPGISDDVPVEVAGHNVREEVNALANRVEETAVQPYQDFENEIEKEMDPVALVFQNSNSLESDDDSDTAEMPVPAKEVTVEQTPISLIKSNKKKRPASGSASGSFRKTKKQKGGAREKSVMASFLQSDNDLIRKLQALKEDKDAHKNLWDSKTQELDYKMKCIENAVRLKELKGLPAKIVSHFKDLATFVDADDDDHTFITT